MGMGIGTNTQKADEGELKRTQEEIACGVWFTSTGNTMPRIIKFQDGEGMIRTITNIRILIQEKKQYCGIPVWEYRCSTLSNEREYLFRLYYYPEECKWKISWNC